VGTAYSADSHLWFTLWRGIVTEVYFPRIDRPQLRDLEFLVTDGETFFQEEKRQLTTTTVRPADHALAYRVTAADPEGRYRIHKSVITDPHLPCLLLNTRLELLKPDLQHQLRLFVLAAPHLDGGGWGNDAMVINVLGQSVLVAERNGVALALATNRPFVRTSVGYVGASDGWTDLSLHRTLNWEFDRAPNGNVALTGEIPVHSKTEFTLGLAFGESIPAALTCLFQSLSTPFEAHHRRFVEQWNRPVMREVPLGKTAHDGGRLYRASRSILLAHEDKVYPGAFIASLSIPWGASKNDEDRGGYHLVWTRDMVHTATALLASGDHDAPLRALVYLSTRQRADGGFPQNFWVDGTPYWQGMQLDEVALPILLAWRLQQAHALREFDPYPMVRRATRFLIERGPVTQEDRWEEVGGYSPSTLAACIAGLTVAAHFARARSDSATATFIQEYADFLESHVERWTVTTRAPSFPARPATMSGSGPRQSMNRSRTRALTWDGSTCPTCRRDPRRTSRPTRSWMAVSLTSYGTASARRTTPSSSIPSTWSTESSASRPRSGRRGTASITMGTESATTGARTPPGAWDGRGRCSPASGATTSLPGATIPTPTCARWNGSRLRPTICPNRSGTRTTARPSISSRDAPRKPRCRSCGPTPST